MFTCTTGIPDLWQINKVINEDGIDERAPCDMNNGRAESKNLSCGHSDVACHVNL